jgi:hypothetical protein
MLPPLASPVQQKLGLGHWLKSIHDYHIFFVSHLQTVWPVYGSGVAVTASAHLRE